MELLGSAARFQQGEDRRPLHPRPGPRPYQVKAMRKPAIGLVAVLLWSFAAALHAQAPTQDDTAAASRLNLTLEQRHVIKEVIKDMKIAPATTSVQSIGDAVPQDAALQPMPSDVGRKVPQVKTHRFMLTAGRILIVDPKDNKVAEVIELN
jgi:Protein of unknown function (DUF1236)